MEDTKNYGASGLTIRAAMVDQFKRFPDKKNRPHSLLWNGLRIKTGDSIPVPNQGVVRGEFVSSKTDIEQGFDIDVDGGCQLQDGTWVHPLRSWNDPRYSLAIEYPFRSTDCLLWVWNVYKMKYPGGQVVEERWTENAGMWVEEVSPKVRIYHCSHGMANPPDFECLVFKINILTEQGRVTYETL